MLVGFLTQAFSSVPYEKGSQFLYFLELTVGGPALFEPFLKAYVNKVHPPMVYQQPAQRHRAHSLPCALCVRPVLFSSRTRPLPRMT